MGASALGHCHYPGGRGCAGSLGTRSEASLLWPPARGTHPAGLTPGTQRSLEGDLLGGGGCGLAEGFLDAVCRETWRIPVKVCHTHSASASQEGAPVGGVAAGRQNVYKLIPGRKALETRGDPRDAGLQSGPGASAGGCPRALALGAALPSPTPTPICRAAAPARRPESHCRPQYFPGLQGLAEKAAFAPALP